MSTIVTGLASFGMSGKIFHAPLLQYHAGFYLKTVVERSKETAQKIYPQINSIKTFEELLNDKEIELVIINTPDNFHASMAAQALEAGKNVIVEKPFTQNINDGEFLINLAKKKNLILSVFQNRRWDGDFLTVKEIINKGMLGRLVEYESHFDRFRNYIQTDSWKEDPDTGTGTLYNLGSHMIDQALVLFGMPKAIQADLNAFRTGGKVDDNYDVRLYYPDIKVTLKGSYLVKEPGPRYILHGTTGSFLKYGIDPQEEDLKAGVSLSNSNWGKDKVENWGILNTEINSLHFKGRIETISGNYLNFYNNIYDVIRKKAILEVKAEDSLNVIKIINAAILSNAENKAVAV